MVSRQLQTSVLAACLLACCLAASAVKIGPSASSFAAHVGKLTGYPEESYSGYATETAEVCLSIIGSKDCRNNYDASPDYYKLFSTNELGCCDDEHDDHKVIPKEPVTMVTCDKAGISYCAKPIYIIGDEKDTCQTTKVGSATITCTFKDASEKCSGAVCKGLTITAETTIYGTYGYTHHLPTAPRLDKSCGGNSSDSSRKIAGSAPLSCPGYVWKTSAPAQASTPAKAQGYKEGVYAGWSYIYSGPITSVNGAKDHKWCGGWVELTNQWEQAEVVECPNNPWIHPQTLKLDLVKTAKSEGKY